MTAETNHEQAMSRPVETIGKIAIGLTIIGIALLVTSLCALIGKSPIPSAWAVTHIIGVLLCLFATAFGWASHATVTGRIAAYAGSTILIARWLIDFLSM